MPKTSTKPAPGTTPGASEGPTFDVAEYADELSVARDNHQIGNSIWFENDRVQVWDLTLQPGERLPFHCHDQDYFWTVIDPARVIQRFEDGTSRLVEETDPGASQFLTYGKDEYTVHDLENVDDKVMRGVTVILKS